jgi:hypothetical protein
MVVNRQDHPGWVQPAAKRLHDVTCMTHGGGALCLDAILPSGRRAAALHRVGKMDRLVFEDPAFAHGLGPQSSDPFRWHQEGRTCINTSAWSPWS